MSIEGRRSTFTLLSAALVVLCFVLQTVPLGYAIPSEAVTVNSSNNASAQYAIASLYIYEGGTYVPITEGAFDEGEANYSSHRIITTTLTLSVSDLYLGIYVRTSGSGTYVIQPVASTSTSGYTATYTFTIGGTDLPSSGEKEVSCAQGINYFPLALKCTLSYYSVDTDPSPMKSSVIIKVSKSIVATNYSEGSLTVSSSSTVETIAEEIEESFPVGGGYTLVEDGDDPGTFVINKNGSENLMTNGSVAFSFSVPKNTTFIVKIDRSGNTKPIRLDINNTTHTTKNSGYFYNGSTDVTTNINVAKSDPFVNTSEDPIVVTIDSAANMSGSVSMSIIIGPFT